MTPMPQQFGLKLWPRTPAAFGALLSSEPYTPARSSTVPPELDPATPKYPPSALNASPVAPEVKYPPQPGPAFEPQTPMPLKFVPRLSPRTAAEEGPADVVF